jgi:hypothetical protein
MTEEQLLAGLECFKCHSRQDLSIKKHDRHGTPVLICKSCRREDYKRWVIAKKKVELIYIAPTNKEQWKKLSKENIMKVSSRYA